MAIAKINAQAQIDVVVGVGILSSKVLTNQASFPIPTISSIQLSSTLNEGTKVIVDLPKTTTS